MSQQACTMQMLLHGQRKTTSSMAAAADGLRMRSGPGTDFGRVATVPTGTQVTALGVDGTDGWILVQYNGAYGWLTKQYLTAN